MVFCRYYDQRTGSFAGTLELVAIYHRILGWVWLCWLMCFFFVLFLFFLFFVCFFPVLDLNANVVLAPSLVRRSSNIAPPIFWGNVISGLDSCARTLCCELARVATDEPQFIRSNPRLGGFGYVGWLFLLRCGLVLVVWCDVFCSLFDADLNVQPWRAAPGSPNVDSHPTHIFCIK